MPQNNCFTDTAPAFAILGGDRRSSFLAELLAADGFLVSAIGFERQSEPMSGTASLSAIKDCDVLVLPLPVSLDGRTVNAPFSDMVYPLDEVFSMVPPDTLVLGGRVDGRTAELAARHRLHVRDYYEREELMIRNAIPTAEGALQIAMEETAFTIHGSDCLVLGFGRVARAMAALLKAVGAQVTVAARRWSDFASIDAHGYTAMDIRRMQGKLGEFDLVFNTVPAPILDAGLLGELNRECLVIDLASKPGGVDFDTARTLGVRAIWALSLPGRVAPLSAGATIKQTVLNMLAEEGLL